MGYQLWLSPYTGLRRKGTTFRELQTLFIDQITTKFITEPLYSCRTTDSSMDVRIELEKRDFDYVGVIDQNENVIGYCKREELEGGPIELYQKGIDVANVITDSTALCKLFSCLDERGVKFVMTGNRVEGIVTNWDINKPIVRIYLFGIISLFELHINYWINFYNKNGSWEEKLNEERLTNARKILENRKGSNDELTLLECIQLADKKEILRATDKFLNEFEYSKGKLKKMLEDVETIRNEVAHSQNSITSNLKWADFTKTISSIESYLELSEKKLEANVHKE